MFLVLQRALTSFKVASSRLMSALRSSSAVHASTRIWLMGRRSRLTSLLAMRSDDPTLATEMEPCLAARPLAAQLAG